MIIGVFGISGVGKTTLVKNSLLHYKNVAGFSASELIRKHGGTTVPDDLTIDSATQNQTILLDAIRQYQKTNSKPLILELHNILETPKEHIIIDGVFDFLKINAACFIYKNPKAIIKQRANDVKKPRNVTSATDIDHLQNLSLELFKNRFSKINHTIIKNHHQKFLNSFIIDVLY